MKEIQSRLILLASIEFVREVSLQAIYGAIMTLEEFSSQSWNGLESAQISLSRVAVGGAWISPSESVVKTERVAESCEDSDWIRDEVTHIVLDYGSC